MKKLTKSGTKIRIADEGAPIEAVKVLGMAVLSPCKVCGSKAHSFDVYQLKNATCHRCHRKGHIRPVCKARLPKTLFREDPAIPRTRL